MGNVGNKPLPLVEQVLLKSGVDAKSGPDAATLRGVREFVRSDTQHGYGRRGAADVSADGPGQLQHWRGHHVGK